MNFNISCDIIRLYTGILVYNAKTSVIHKDSWILGEYYMIYLSCSRYGSPVYLQSQ